MVHKIRNYVLTMAEMASCFLVSFLSLFRTEPLLLAELRLKHCISNSLPVSCGCVTKFWPIIYKGKVTTLLGNLHKGKTNTLFYLLLPPFSEQRQSNGWTSSSCIGPWGSALRMANNSIHLWWSGMARSAYMQNLYKLERNALLSSFSHCHFCFLFFCFWFGFLHLTKT